MVYRRKIEYAVVAELADALSSGGSGMTVRVRVSPTAPIHKMRHPKGCLFCAPENVACEATYEMGIAVIIWI